MKSRVKKKRYKWIAYVAVIVIITIAVVLNGKFLKHKDHLPSGIEIKKEDYPITGIDVSAHTGKIDFAKIKKQDIDFVFIKNISEHPLNHIANSSLGVCDTNIQWHLCNPIKLHTGLISH